MMPVESEFSSSFMGQDGYVWFFARVVNREDPQQLGRVQIRIFGLHVEDTSKIPDKHLPWAYPLQPVTSPARNGIGTAPLGLQEGSIVHGFFLDGNMRQIPVVTHTLAGAPGGTNDLPELALGTQSLPKSVTGVEPNSPYAAKYPFNRVTQTESGHVIEIDDTPGAERIQIWHRKGSYIEIDKDGNRVTKTVGDNFAVTVEDENVYVGGNANIFVKGNIRIEAYNDVTLNAAGQVSIATPEDFRVKAKNVYFETDETFQILAAGDINMDGANMGLMKDRAQSSGLDADQQRALDFYVPKVEDGWFFGSDDDNSGEETVNKGIANGMLNPSQGGDLDSAESYSRKRTVPAKTTQCGVTVDESQNLDSVVLTKNYTVGSLSSHTAVSSHVVAAQAGLTIQEIVCNLKLLADNVLETIKSKYPDMIVTCGFRRGSGSSKHHLGCAADLQYKSLNSLGDIEKIREGYYERAKWIADNCPIDALLLEYKTFGSKLPWHHVQFIKGSQRGLLQTYNNNSKYANDLHLLKG